MTLVSRTTYRAAADDGFTLVETLIALFVLSLISLFVFMALRTGMRIWTGYSQASDMGDEVAVAQDIVRELVNEAYPAIDKAVEANGNLTFRGTESALELDSRLPRQIVSGGFYHVRLFRDEHEQLVLSWTDPFSAEPSPGENAILVKKVSQLHFAYYGRTTTSSDRAEWHTDWENQPRLPVAVRISITQDRTGVWPDIVAATKINADATCVYDALTSGCRGR